MSAGHLSIRIGRASLFGAAVLGAFSLLPACSAAGEDDAETSDAHLELPACPTTDPAITAALTKITHVATTCGTGEPPASDKRPWRHTVESPALTLLEDNHRGRDAFYAVGEDQWVLGKFSYGPIDTNLTDEDVDIWVHRDCEGGWEKLGTATTTSSSAKHETIEGVEDNGGWLYFRIPEAKRLGVGRHRVRMVVAGDATFAEQYIEVLPKGTPIMVSDVDGTLTERKMADSTLACDEESELPALWRAFRDIHGDLPYVHEGAPSLYSRIASAGYRPMYLTARPEWLTNHTRRFLSQAQRGDGRGDLPEGIVHTTLWELGATSAQQAADFKTAELAAIRKKGFIPTFGFGNRMSDVAAYDANGFKYKFFFENQSTVRRNCSDVLSVKELTFGTPATPGDWRVKSFVGLMEGLGQIPSTCR